ncbi:hypothetical protein Lmor_0194 [Legionella moravica]|uniref:Uncharacterized protein n=1 Tax=Legionella moravica TaxID=39962 RepID=A0A378K3F5_9GAMM|nr:hypothetical protein [Legionella moravica]KTD38791.1 hypothetical protein Lmor_0194 [Legionella moravica]STX63789.1 Uncharacterised protein [Legionella moravica]
MKRLYSSLFGAALCIATATSYADEQTCNNHYDYCMSSCNNQYNQCTQNNNEESYCKDQYQPCIQGCSNTRDSCLSQ